MLTGYCDSIARKAPLGSIEITPGMSRRKRLTGKILLFIIIFCYLLLLLILIICSIFKL